VEIPNYLSLSSFNVYSSSSAIQAPRGFRFLFGEWENGALEGEEEDKVGSRSECNIRSVRVSRRQARVIRIAYAIWISDEHGMMKLERGCNQR
jgi:hypothetical protein